MTAKDYFFSALPKRCGVHPSFGKVAELVYLAELEGEESFSRVRFRTVEERARLALPYRPAIGYEEVWDSEHKFAMLFFLESDKARGKAYDKNKLAELHNLTLDETQVEVLKQVRDVWN